MGYFPSYRNLADVPDVKFRMCNVVNYAFFSVNSAGLLTENNAALVPQLISKAKANNAKVFLSINDGAGDGDPYSASQIPSHAPGIVVSRVLQARA